MIDKRPASEYMEEARKAISKLDDFNEKHHISGKAFSSMIIIFLIIVLCFVYLYQRKHPKETAPETTVIEQNQETPAEEPAEEAPAEETTDQEPGSEEGTDEPGSGEESEEGSEEESEESGEEEESEEEESEE